MAIDTRGARTVRIPIPLLHEAQDVIEGRESLNDLIVTAIEREVRRRRANKALDNIELLSARIRAEAGIQPSSTQMIRDLREGIGRRD
ncbi:MAG: YlcI/YnfO family protein [Chloroflexota bacterium]